MYPKRFAIWMLLLLVFATLMGCDSTTGAPDDAATAESPVALPEPDEAEATVFVTGGSVTGTAFWGTEPLPGARVELRSDEWRISGDETAVAEGETDAAGRFMLTDVPPGEWSIVAFFPDGELSAGGTPVVTVTQGQGIDAAVVRLEREMVLLAPDLAEPGVATPTLRWEPLDGVPLYRVMLIHMGTTEAVVQEMVSGDSLTVADGVLEPGVRYTIVISGMAEAGGEPLANFTGEYAAGAP